VLISEIIVAGHTYTIQYRGNLRTGPWLKLADVSAQHASGLVSVTDTNTGGAARFYRVVTPAQP
jgi:hypothetical protein